MKNNQNNKRVFLTVMFVAILTIIVIGTSFAFFNYTRTGSANTVRTGRINFTSSQDGRINLSNIFPIDPTETGVMDDATKVGTVAITVTGDTSYDKGVEYLISATNVSNTVGTKNIPISISATTSGTLGTADEDYFDDRDTATSHIYKVLAKDTINNDDQLMVGYIAKNTTGINGTITIKAYIDKNNIAITDTPEENTNWQNGREVFTTTEWNSMQGTGVSFQVRVEANEGIWVEEQFTTNAMNYFPGVIMNQSSNIKEIYFNKMDADAMQTRYDAATIKGDITYNNEGKVLAWLEADPVDNTKYIMYVASDGKTYLITAGGLFAPFSNSLEKIEFNNVNTSRVDNMNGMFSGCSKIRNIDISSFNTSIVTNMSGMFAGCSSLVNIDLVGLGSDYLTTVMGIFDGCTNLKNVNMSRFNFGVITDLSSSYSPFYLSESGCNNIESIDLSGANMQNVTNLSYMFADPQAGYWSRVKSINLSNMILGNVTNMSHMFSGCDELEMINLTNFNTSSVTDMNFMFYKCTSLTSLDLSNFNTSNVTDMSFMFYYCNNINTIYVSNTWNISGVTSSSNMFDTCTSLVGGNGTIFAFGKDDVTMAVIDTPSTPGYLTLKQS